jgi:PAS domain S-box-containing protein
LSDQRQGLESQDRESIWASALSAAAAVARRTSSSEEDVLHSVTLELRRLRMAGAVSLLTDDGRLRLMTRSISPILEHSLHRLTGLETIGYTFDPREVSIYRQALESGEAVYTPDRRAVIAQMLPSGLRPMLSRLMSMLGQRPVIVAPLILEDRALGVLNVTAIWLKPHDAPMVKALADHIAISLGHVRARIEMSASLQRERLRNQMVEAVASALDLSVVLERVIRLAAQITGAEAGAIALLDPRRGDLTYPYIYNLPAELSLHAAPASLGLARRVIEERKPILLDEYSDSPAALPNWSDAGLHGFLGLPLVAGDESIGALGLFMLDRRKRFHSEQIEMAIAMARMAAIAVKNAQLYSDARLRDEESRALIHTAHSISSSLDLETVLGLIAEQAMLLMHADGSRIHLYDPDSNRLRCLVARGPEAEAVLSIELQPGEGLVGNVMSSGEPLLTNAPAMNPHAFQIPGTPEDEPEAMILAPLQVRQRTMGVMTVRRQGSENPFSISDLNLLSAFAAHAAVAIENAHLFGQIESQALRLEAEVAKRTRDLSLSEARYRALVETSLAGIFQLDPAGKIVYANRAFADLLEARPDQVIGSRGLNYVVPSYRKHLLNSVRDSIRAGVVLREVFSLELRSRSLRRIPALVAASLILDDQGDIQGLTGLALDISERISLEAELRAERDRLDAILSNIADAVLVTNNQGRIEYVNPAFQRLTGYSPEEALAASPILLKNPEHSESEYDALLKCIHDGAAWSGEVINLRKDGSSYDAAISLTPIVDAAGQVINFVLVQYDISALKEVDRLKSQFVSDVSHELRTPLTNIRLYLDLLATTGDRQKAAAYLETLSRESNRLASLIDDLLSLSRLESGTITPEFKAVDLSRLLSTLVEDRRTLAGSRGLTLLLDLQPQAGPALGDERLLSQVFTNLLTNAMNYTPQGGTITIRAGRAHQNDRDWLSVQVSDTGLGVPQAEQNLIFRRFFRGQAGQSTGTSGTGLGLAICREITERHGGHISLRSDGIPGHGTHFTVLLPIAATA